MKTYTIYQEVILVADTTITKQDFCEQHSCSSNRVLTAIEQLEEACWLGLLDEFIPEIMKRSSSGKRLYVWNTRLGAFSIKIQLSEFPMFSDPQFSIDPDLYLLNACYN